MITIDILTLFPRAFDGVLDCGIVKIAREKGLLEVALRDFRAFAKDKYRSVDDKPYGGGPGMVLLCEPIFLGHDALVEERRGQLGDGVEPRVVQLTPQGRRLDQELLEELAKERWLMLLCGHYEGFDERVRLGLEPTEVSIGDYVLSGGEVPAMVLLDGIARLQPGALGAPDGARDDSFARKGGLLEPPQYTRPREFRGMEVPEVLVSGDHGAVARWREEQALLRTRERRPDLLDERAAQKKTPSLGERGDKEP